jgi:DNA repair photolyase
MLRDELRRKRKTGLVSTGAMSDPYNPFEKELEVTRWAFQLLLQYGFGAAFTTKSALAARDAELLYAIQLKAPVRACFSITTESDELSGKVEPHASSTSLRFEALAVLSRAGVFAGIWLNPVLPFLTDTEENIRAILRRTKECGGQFAVCSFGVTLREGDREYFYQALDRDFPGIKEKYAQVFGLDYICPSPRAKELKKVFREECERLGLLYRFPDINQATLARQSRQMSLF